MKNKTCIFLIVLLSLFTVFLIGNKLNLMDNINNLAANVNSTSGSITITCDSNNLSVNESTSCSVKGNLNDAITSVSGKLASTSNLQISSISKASFWQGEVYNNKLELYCEPHDGSNFDIATFTVTALSNGSGSVSFTDIDNDTKVNIGDSTWNAVEVSEAIYSIDVAEKTPVVPAKSSVNTLSSLSISNASISFNPDVTSYSVSVENTVSSITIVAAATDSKATVEGIGIKNLSVGENNFSVVVTAEDGSQKTYSIKVIRKEATSTKSSDSSLKSLSVTNATLNTTFKSTTTSYTTTIDSTVSTIKINATANSSKATIKGDGEKSPKEGTTTYKVVVTAEDGSTTTYSIKVTKKSSTTNNSSSNTSSSSSSSNTSSTNTTSSSSNSTNTTTTTTTQEVKKDNNSLLKELIINDKSITLSDTVFKYNFSVLYEVEKLDIKVTTQSEKAKATVSGGKELNVGKNTVTILVTAEDNTTSTYTITVTRKKEEEKLSNDSSLQFLMIENYGIEFKSDVYEYNVKIKNENELKINYTTNDMHANVVVKGNENLKNDSIISVLVTAEDGTTSEYSIKVEKTNYLPIIIISVVGVLLLGALGFFGIRFIKTKKIKTIENEDFESINIPEEKTEEPIEQMDDFEQVTNDKN